MSNSLEIRDAVVAVVAYLRDEEKDYKSRASAREKDGHIWNSVRILRDALAKGEFD
jgi:hypothetical protein